ncbi:hypothetical protein CUMW_198180 [Citrus unshiu]|uniref:Uncharacterized protein n=1 Tax=Citrus unshiu TaxID=55188 RepID=A0A2H5Q5N5_CITUN|nr:hypothetical protein CUMW_198180 [Citrus unshiu]
MLASNHKEQIFLSLSPSRFSHAFPFSGKHINHSSTSDLILYILGIKRKSKGVGDKGRWVTCIIIKNNNAR